MPLNYTHGAAVPSQFSGNTLKWLLHQDWSILGRLLDGQRETHLGFSPPSTSPEGTHFKFFHSSTLRYIVHISHVLFANAGRETKEKDVAIKVLYCGICHTDLHNAKSEWGQSFYPLVPGYASSTS